MRRTGRTLLACLALACMLTGPARAGQGLLVGVADDTLKWSDKPTAQRALTYSRDLGLRAVRVTVPWTPGQTRLGVLDRQPVDRMILATWGGGLRVVLAVYGKADDAPQTGSAARRLLPVRRQPPPTLPRRPRRRDLERAQLEPILASPVRRRRHESRAGGVRSAARPLLGRSPRGAAGRERDRRLLPTRQRQPERCLERLPLAGQLLPQARAGLPPERTTAADLRHGRTQPVPGHQRGAAVGEAHRARRRSPRGTTTS